MTEKYYALTVVLEKDVRVDDSEPIVNAIKMIKGVQSIKGNIATPETWMAEERARMDMQKKLLSIVFPKKDNRE